MDVAHSEGSIDEQTEELAEEEIVERIFEAIIDQRLPAGTKLSESSLCEAFGVGRMRIRQSLLLLASREVVDLLPKRGAFVASPTADQAREVFEARLTIEPKFVNASFERDWMSVSSENNNVSAGVVTYLKNSDAPLPSVVLNGVLSVNVVIVTVVVPTDVATLFASLLSRIRF